MCLCFQLHLSISLSTGGDDGMKLKRDTEIIPVQSLNLLLKSIGATLTDVQDVVFKYERTRRPNRQHMNCAQWCLFIFVWSLWVEYGATRLIYVFYFRLAFFELTFRFCTTQQLQWEVIRHYSKQVTQWYNNTGTAAVFF